jgi:phosphoglycolate phosphatase
MRIPPLSLVLDLDGTLVDSLPDIRASLSHILQVRGRRAVSMAEARTMLGDGAERLVDRALSLTGAPLGPAQQGAFLRDFLTHYARHSADTTACFPGAEATLARLAADGHLLGVCTNKPHQPTLILLAALGLAGRFDAVLGGDHGPHRKPHPGHLWRTVDLMGGRQRPVVMVGDSLPDAEVARRAGVPFVLAAYGYAREPLELLRPDAIIERFDDLPGVLEELLRP